MGGTHRAHPPRSANELGCQANGGARAGRAPPLDPPMVHTSRWMVHGDHCLTGFVPGVDPLSPSTIVTIGG